MTLFRNTGRRPSRLHRILAAAELEDAVVRAESRREEMPPRPPQYRPAAEPQPETWGGGVRGMQGDPCGSGPVQDTGSDEEVA